MNSSILNKKRQATHIAPLQPPILAAFRPWGGSAGAGRVRPAAAKISKPKFVPRSFALKIFDVNKEQKAEVCDATKLIVVLLLG